MKKLAVLFAMALPALSANAIETIVITNLTVPGQTEIQRQSFVDIEGGLVYNRTLKKTRPLTVFDGETPGGFQISAAPGPNIFEVHSTTNALENGQRLLDAVSSATLAGGVPIVVLDEGDYDLGTNTLSVSSYMHITSRSPFGKLIGQPGVSFGYKATPFLTCALYSSNSTVIALADNLSYATLYGLKINGNISCPDSSFATYNQASSFIRCHILGNVASNENTTVQFFNCVVEGSVCQGGVSGVKAYDSWFLGDNSFTGNTGSSSYPSIFDNCYIDSDNSFPRAFLKATWKFRDSTLVGSGHFSGSNSYIELQRCVLSGASWSGTYGTSDKVYYTVGVPASVTGTTMKVYYSIDSSGNPLANQ